MKTLSVGFIMLFLCYACKPGNGSSDGNSVAITAMGDSSAVVQADSLVMDSAAKAAIPKNLDETFDDFVYTYASDKRFQLYRTHFPLPYVKDTVRVEIKRSEWIHDALYTNLEFYNILFDKEEDMEIEKDTRTDKVNVSWLFLDKKEARHYYFERNKGYWMLENITQKSYGGGPNEAFLSFFYEFCNDSVFQREHIAPSLKFVTNDPDDDFNVIEAFISVDQWFAFRPSLPKNKMTNIDYGQSYSAKSRHKIVTFRGIGTGYSNTLFFTRDGNSWKLTEYEDLSN